MLSTDIFVFSMVVCTDIELNAVSKYSSSLSLIIILFVKEVNFISVLHAYQAASLVEYFIA